jgi:hypothetical protein
MATRGQWYKTFYRGNLPSLHGTAVTLCYNNDATVNGIEWQKNYHVKKFYNIGPWW